VKRLLDIVVSALALVILAPVLLVLAALVRVKLGSPVFFTQERAGRGGRVFRVWKFRTMTAECDEQGCLRPDEDRLTSFGKWLRATSADELPEFWNVLRGDMSLVGPRPLLVDYLERYTPEQARRHEVRPGITGPAQVSGRNEQGWDERLRLDVWYVDNRSLLLDLKLLFATPLKVLRREGITSPGHASMPVFDPSRDDGAGA
jgi:lipopolysaccharide/colanic/teichoic acid biosynthesis glycosyltransferase